MGWIAYVALGLLPAYLAAGYFFVWLLARWCGAIDRSPPTPQATRRWLILVPAHDEATELPQLLASSRQLDYPPALVTVAVVADNCRDNTASLAREHGAICLERNDPQHPGKGRALAWALARFLGGAATRELNEAPVPVTGADFAAVMVIDADCTLDPSVLRQANFWLDRGERVLQCNHRITNTDANSISYVATVGRTLEYDLYFAPKSACGFPVLLVGTGMIFARELLAEMPWDSESCAEDTAYTLMLSDRGIYVRFLPDAYVNIRAVTSGEEMRVQRTRWAAGNLAPSRFDTWRRLVRGVGEAQGRAVDLACMRLLQSRPLILAHAGLTCGAGILAMRPTLAAHFVRPFDLLLAALIGLHAIVVVAALTHVGWSRRRLGLLLAAPWVVISLIGIALRALTGASSNSWQRTPRS